MKILILHLYLQLSDGGLKGDLCVCITSLPFAGLTFGSDSIWLCMRTCWLSTGAGECFLLPTLLLFQQLQGPKHPESSNLIIGPRPCHMGRMFAQDNGASYKSDSEFLGQAD